MPPRTATAARSTRPAPPTPDDALPAARAAEARGAGTSSAAIFLWTDARGADRRRGGRRRRVPEGATSSSVRSARTPKAEKAAAKRLNLADPEPADDRARDRDRPPEGFPGGADRALGHAHARPRRPGQRSRSRCSRSRATSIVTDQVPGASRRPRPHQRGVLRVRRAPGALETVRALTGLPINYFVTVNFRGFMELVEQPRRRLDRRRPPLPLRRRATVPDVYATINLRPGYQRLNATSRRSRTCAIRHIDSDIYRDRAPAAVPQGVEAADLAHARTSTPSLDIVNAVEQNVVDRPRRKQPLDLRRS